MSWVLAMDIGASSVSAGLVSREGEVRFRRLLKTVDETHEHPLIPRLAEAAREIYGQAKDAGLEVAGMGIGSPGIVNTDLGVVVAAGNIPELFGAHLAERISKPLGLKLQLENDVNAQALGEMLFGVAQGQRNFVVFSLGTDLGGGIVIDGKLYRGTNFIASEFGHITLDLDGQECVCGSYGCASEWVSGAGLAEKGRELLPHESMAVKLAGGKVEDLQAGHIFQAAEKGDEPAQELLHEFYRRFGAVVSSVMKVLDPELVILGGQVCRSEPQIIGEVVRWTRHYYFPIPKLPEFRLSEFTKETAILGPAAAFFVANGDLP